MGRIIVFIAARFTRFGVIGLASDIVFVPVARTPAIAAVTLLMTVALLLSNIVNNAAVAIVMALLALQSNLPVTGFAGYEFRNFWPFGLPVSLRAVVADSIAIVSVWPLRVQTTS